MESARPDAGRAGAVFAEARSAARWRHPIRNSWVAGQASAVVGRALADLNAPTTQPTFQVLRRFDVDGDRSEHSDIYFGARRRLFDAAIGALLSEDVPITSAENMMWAICDEYTWALPAHIPELSSPTPAIPHDQIIDLFSAETAFALAEIITMLGERLHPLVVSRVRGEIERRVFVPFRERSWFWESVATNWSSVCAAGVGIAAMHLEPEGLEGILERCTVAMDALLSGYGDDGACAEGLNYWNYGFGHFAYYAQALTQYTGVDLWAGRHRRKLDAIARFPARIWLGGRAVAAFSDAEPYGTVSPALAGLLESFDSSYAVPRVLWDTAGWSHNWGPFVRQFVWARDAAEATPAISDSAEWFPDAQWLVVRDTGGRQSIGFAAKAGHNDEPHNHNDVGSFVLAVNGNPVLSELGMGHYDAAYFVLDTRYESLSAGSHGHSVPIIAGVRQHHGRAATASVEQVSADTGRLVIDLAPAYDLPGLVGAQRSFEFARGVLTIDDEFTVDHDVEIVDRFVSLFPIVIDDDGAVISGPEGGVRVTWETGWEPRVHEIEFRTHDGPVATASVLDLFRVASHARCQIVITPFMR